MVNHAYLKYAVPASTDFKRFGRERARCEGPGSHIKTCLYPIAPRGRGGYRGATLVQHVCGRASPGLRDDHGLCGDPPRKRGARPEANNMSREGTSR